MRYLNLGAKLYTHTYHYTLSYTYHLYTFIIIYFIHILNFCLFITIEISLFFPPYIVSQKCLLQLKFNVVIFFGLFRYMSLQLLWSGELPLRFVK